uniref:Uncharacterized protein n=1 Tax=Aegilops tauschii subsp. strangulata TaxID=200361 RepID=A0A452Y3J5_AEGTS
FHRQVAPPRNQLNILPSPSPYKYRRAPCLFPRRSRPPPPHSISSPHFLRGGREEEVACSRRSRRPNPLLLERAEREEGRAEDEGHQQPAASTRAAGQGYSEIRLPK